MPKCKINNDKEIINFWDDSHSQIPEDALDCDIVKSPKGIGDPNDSKYFWKLVDGIVTPTEAGIAWEAQEYARARQPLYPAIGDQLDDLYHKGAFSAEMTATIKKVKDDNPK